MSEVWTRHGMTWVWEWINGNQGMKIWSMGTYIVVWNYDALEIEEGKGCGDWVWTETMGMEYQKLNILTYVPPECSPCVVPP